MINCPKCKTPLLTVIYNQEYPIKNLYINRDEMTVIDDYFQGESVSKHKHVINNSSDDTCKQLWCETCDVLFVYCCDEFCIITSHCCLTNNGWCKFEDGKFIEYSKDKWPYEYLNVDSNMNIATLNIINHNDFKLKDFYITGPEGGVDIGYKCKKCDGEYWFNDK